MVSLLILRVGIIYREWIHVVHTPKERQEGRVWEDIHHCQCKGNLTISANIM
jgi:hypothetical protein